MWKRAGDGKPNRWRACKPGRQEFLCELGEAELKRFEAIRSLSEYPTGSVVFTEQEDSRGVFVLCEGQIKLSIRSKEGRVLTLRILNPGDVLGLMAVVAGLPYEATAETLQASQVAFIQRDDFLRFIRDHPEAYSHVLKAIVSSYKGLFDQLRILGFAPVPKRLARTLLDWSEATDGESKNGTRIEMSLTHEEIAELIGSSRETVTRTLADFKHRHLIAIREGTVTIRDREGLEELAGG